MNKFNLLSSAVSEEYLRNSINDWFCNEPYEIIDKGKYKTIKKDGKIFGNADYFLYLYIIKKNTLFT